MERLKAADFYFFSDGYFDDLRHMLKGRLHFCTVLSPDGQLAAAGLFTQTDEIVQHHLGATAPAYRKYAPSKLMLDAVIRWGKSIGAAVMHLGGGVGGRAESVFELKPGSARLAPSFTRSE